MSPEARERFFDELATGLASGSISRGKALRLMGAALVGGTLVSLGIGEAAADPPGCKRNGKVCTKDKVCCSGNCEGGKCAAACTSNGGTCGGNGECCSGRCASGLCAEACPSGTVLLCNGTCARRCPDPRDPGTCGSGCEGCATEISTGLQFCGRADPAQTRCSTCSDCPTGQFCHNFGTTSVCDFAC